MQASGQHSDEEIVSLVLATCFDGLAQTPIKSSGL